MDTTLQAQFEDAFLTKDLSEIYVTLNAHPELDLNAQDNSEQGWTPLIWAIQLDSYELVETLIRRGAKVYLPDKTNKHPLSHAVMNKRILQLLLEHGANLDDQDDEGNTALHYALMNEHSAYEVLFEAGANERVRNHQDQTPLVHLLKLPRPKTYPILLSLLSGPTALNYLFIPAEILDYCNGNDFYEAFDKYLDDPMISKDKKIRALEKFLLFSKPGEAHDQYSHKLVRLRPEPAGKLTFFLILIQAGLSIAAFETLGLIPSIFVGLVYTPLMIAGLKLARKEVAPFLYAQFFLMCAFGIPAIFLNNGFFAKLTGPLSGFTMALGIMLFSVTTQIPILKTILPKSFTSAYNKPDEVWRKIDYIMALQCVLDASLGLISVFFLPTNLFFYSKYLIEPLVHFACLGMQMYLFKHSRDNPTVRHSVKHKPFNSEVADITHHSEGEDPKPPLLFKGFIQDYSREERSKASLQDTPTASLRGTQ